MSSTFREWPLPFLSVPATCRSLSRKPFPSPACQNHTQILLPKQNAILTLKARSDSPFSAQWQHSCVTCAFIGQVDVPALLRAQCYTGRCPFCGSHPHPKAEHHYRRRWFVQDHTAGKGGARLRAPSVSLQSLGTAHASSCLSLIPGCLMLPLEKGGVLGLT